MIATPTNSRQLLKHGNFEASLFWVTNKIVSSLANALPLSKLGQHENMEKIYTDLGNIQIAELIKNFKCFM